ILYELLTQCNPFEGDSITTVIYKIMHAELRPLRDFNKQLPAGLDNVIKKALARDADSRYRSCREMLADLKKYAPGKGQADTIRESPHQERETEWLAGPGIVSPPAAAKNRKPLFILLLAMITVLAVSMGIIWFGGRKRTGPAAAGDPVPGPPPLTGAAASGPGTSVAPAATPVVENTARTGGNAAPGKVKKMLPGAPRPVAAEAPAEAMETTVSASVTNARGFEERVFFNRTVLVRIPGGDFTIGSPPGQGNDDEHPAHRVHISDFWLGKHEVTFEQYDRFCQETGRPLPGDEGWGRGRRPVIHVSWDDADAYCRWLTQKTLSNFRLPTEAEWEKAARSRYPWGSSPPTSEKVNMQGGEDGFPFSAPVGSFPAGESHYGVLDMAGNVWEWIADWYGADYFLNSPRRDPRGPASGSTRVVRGGSWKNGPGLIRSANRSSERPDRHLNVLGFRVAMDSR
ncbi:MAG TPA: SUMF1/EgtB/PvdO family nonheme iron enzyme, partial [Candidatus Binatia bacterium]|nr:SUMF1/EgtB/PvdO family nonheme iron enzyme [Candidatus Binatia bacterium]